jgi:hypothetical protein
MDQHEPIFSHAVSTAHRLKFGVVSDKYAVTQEPSNEKNTHFEICFFHGWGEIDAASLVYQRKSDETPEGANLSILLRHAAHHLIGHAASYRRPCLKCPSAPSCR